MSRIYGVSAGGQVSVKNGTINGSIYSPNLDIFDFTPQYTLPNSVTVSFGASQGQTPPIINFGDAFVKLRNMSRALKGYPISPSASFAPSNGVLNISSKEKELNIVAVPASLLSGMRGINMTVSTGSTLVVNVVGDTDVTFQSMQVASNAGSILWNFPDTTSILMTGGVKFLGSILAPDADVQFDWGGMIYGTLVAKSASPLYPTTGASFEMHVEGLGTFNWPITASAPSRTIYQIDCGSSSGVSPSAADRYYSGGTAFSVTNGITTTGVTKPAPAGVCQSERYGNTTYTLPSLVAGALYTVRLHFAETWWTASGKRKFNVTINDTPVLSNLDIYATTGARYKAMVREFTATADSSGQIVLKFVTVTNNATIAGIELIK
jgi:choice-of-anchor A domain-containing protein